MFSLYKRNECALFSFLPLLFWFDDYIVIRRENYLLVKCKCHVTSVSSSRIFTWNLQNVVSLSTLNFKSFIAKLFYSIMKLGLWLKLNLGHFQSKLHRLKTYSITEEIIINNHN